MTYEELTINRFRLFALILGLIAIATALAVPAVSAAINDRGRTEIVEFDVAEDMSRFVYNKDIAFDDGLPADGSSFITRGYLYPKGTLSCDNGGCSGTDPDGSPQFPDKVIGEWVCEGYMINDAAHAKSGKWVLSTQYFEFTGQAGTQLLVTQGYELADVDVAISARSAAAPASTAMRAARASRYCSASTPPKALPCA